MKNLNKILTTVALVVSCQCFGQLAVEYSYDNAGNRIQRKVIPTGMILTDLSIQEREELKESIRNFEFSVLPNPTNSFVKIQAEQAFLELDNHELRIYDMKGNLIEYRSFNTLEEVVDLRSQASGSYIVKLSGSGGVYSEWRIIKD